jgi:CYRIA/CYRIB Rac1 binding domain
MLSVMAKVCQKMLEMPELKSRLQYEETELFILRVMVAIIILYDHVHPTGAFAKGEIMVGLNTLPGGNV